jgi:hypothetical protein
LRWLALATLALLLLSMAMLEAVYWYYLPQP